MATNDETQSSKTWGGNWTQQKIDVFIKYLPAYLSIMGKQSFHLTYYDGFAGSGEICIGSGDILESVALQVLNITSPRKFDIYYFVDKNATKAEQLTAAIESRYGKRDDVFVVTKNCNEKLIGMADYLKLKPKVRRGLAFIDPYGMQVDYNSLLAFSGVSCDMWMLIPTGIGVNRLLNKDGQVKDTFIPKLEKFLGLPFENIHEQIYKTSTEWTLFGDEERTQKVNKPIDKIMSMYREQLKKIWKFVSEPVALKNEKNVTMFHFLMVSQVSVAARIATDIINAQKNNGSISN
jgi:three-Cys-motif partner protein